MAILIPCELDDPAVSLFRPHDPAGYWSIEVDGTRPGYDVRWHASQAGGDVQLREPALRALVKSAATALGLSVVEVKARTVDADTVPVTITGLPDVPLLGVPAEPATEAWKQ